MYKEYTLYLDDPPPADDQLTPGCWRPLPDGRVLLSCPECMPSVFVSSDTLVSLVSFVAPNIFLVYCNGVPPHPPHHMRLTLDRYPLVGEAKR